jgi:hypothetical protein
LEAVEDGVQPLKFVLTDWPSMITSTDTLPVPVCCLHGGKLGVAIDATGSLIAELKDGVEDGTMLDGARSPARSKKLLSVGHHIAPVQPSPSMDSDSRNRPIEKSATQFVNAGFLGFSSTGLLPAAEHVGIEVYSVA